VVISIATFFLLFQQKIVSLQSKQNIMEETIDLISNLDKIHTTELGVERIKRNLSLNVDDVVDWCKQRVLDENSVIVRKGKNWYVIVDNCEITINASSYTIITAHRLKQK
jgi:hypothetical protein